MIEFSITLIYHYGGMVELYSINLDFMSEAERNELTQAIHEEGLRMFNSNPVYPKYSTLDKDTCVFITNYIQKWEDDQLAEEDDYLFTP